MFQEAIKETQRLDDEESEDNYRVPTEQKNNDVRTLIDMPTWVKNGVPTLNLQMHLYESNGDGSIKVNDKFKFVGDSINDDLKVIAVERDQVVLSYKDELFSLPALSTWE